MIDEISSITHPKKDSGKTITVEPLTNDHPHQRPSLSYDHISCDGQWFPFVYESLTNDHPSHTTTFRVTDSGFRSYTNPSRATIPLIRPHQCDSEGGRIRRVLLYSQRPTQPSRQMQRIAHLVYRAKIKHVGPIHVDV